MRPTRVIIDLAKLRSNIRQLRGLTKKNTEFMAVVKANAYGHGAVEVARQALVSGASWLGVAIPEEGAELREAGIKAPILVLGGIVESQVKTVVEYELTQTIFSLETARLLNEEAKKKQKQVNVHIKVDTGMGRIGVRDLKELQRLYDGLAELKHLRPEGIFTHFAVSDEGDKSFTYKQVRRFCDMIEALNNRGVNFKWIHAANSAAIIDCPNTHFNLVRAGISIYGYYPSDEVLKNKVKLQPVLRWETKVIQVKNISPGDSVSYGRTFVAQVPTRVATISLGYADGYNRLLSNKGWVLIKGEKAPVIGRVCMDQTMVDVTHIPSVRTGDTAVVIGKQGNEVITADDIARICGTISYEILTGISMRVPRVYTGGTGGENEQS